MKVNDSFKQAYFNTPEKRAKLAEDWMALEPNDPLRFGKAIENARCLAIVASWIRFAQAHGASDDAIRLLAKCGSEMADPDPKPLDGVT